MDENSIESIIDTTKSINDGSDKCDINQHKAAANHSTTQLSIATVSAANLDVHHQQQVKSIIPRPWFLKLFIVVVHTFALLSMLCTIHTNL